MSKNRSKARQILKLKLS